MKTSELMQAMAELGAPMDAVILAVRALEEKDAQIEARRAGDRERKRRQRGTVTGQSRDIPETVTAEVTDKGSLEVSPLASPLPKPSKTSPLGPPKPKLVEVPDWMPPAEWEAFKEMRRKMRGVPFTQSAERTVIAKLATLKAEGHDPAKLLSKAVERGHRTVFEDDTTRAAKNGKVERSAQEWRENAEWYVRHGQPDRAEDCRRRAIAIEQRVIQ